MNERYEMTVTLNLDGRFPEHDAVKVKKRVLALLKDECLNPEARSFRLREASARAKTPRFVATAIRKGLRIAGSIGIEEADDKSWLTITFKKLKPIESKGDQA